MKTSIAATLVAAVCAAVPAIAQEVRVTISGEVAPGEGKGRSQGKGHN